MVLMPSSLMSLLPVRDWYGLAYSRLVKVTQNVRVILLADAPYLLYNEVA